MEMPDRENEETLLAAALLLLWFAFARIKSNSTGAYQLFRTKFDQHVTPILRRIYGQARTALGTQFGVEYETVDRPDGPKTIRVPGMDRRIDEYAQNLWEVFRNRADKDQAKKDAGEDVKEFEQGDADRIAATELTKVQSNAEMDGEQDVFRSIGTPLVAVWRVEPGACPICSPLDGTTREWRRVFPDGPPGHPNCRCHLEWREIV